MNLTQSSPHGLAIIGLLDVLVSARTSRDGASLLRVVHKVENGGEGQIHCSCIFLTFCGVHLFPGCERLARRTQSNTERHGVRFKIQRLSSGRFARSSGSSCVWSSLDRKIRHQVMTFYLNFVNCSVLISRRKIAFSCGRHFY